MKTDLTKQMELAIFNETYKQGVFGCFEVTIGWFGRERVDYMTYNVKGEFRCFEIKATKADFHSKAAHTFVGHFGYYVLPAELYPQVKDAIPAGVGVYICYEANGHRYARLQRKAKRQAPSVEVDVLKDSLIRSLAREAQKYYRQEDESLVVRLRRDNSRLQRERDSYSREASKATYELYDLKHPYDLDEEWVL